MVNPPKNTTPSSKKPSSNLKSFIFNYTSCAFFQNDDDAVFKTVLEKLIKEQDSCQLFSGERLSEEKKGLAEIISQEIWIYHSGVSAGLIPAAYLDPSDFWSVCNFLVGLPPFLRELCNKNQSRAKQRVGGGNVRGVNRNEQGWKKDLNSKKLRSYYIPNKNMIWSSSVRGWRGGLLEKLEWEGFKVVLPGKLPANQNFDYKRKTSDNGL